VRNPDICGQATEKEQRRAGELTAPLEPVPTALRGGPDDLAAGPPGHPRSSAGDHQSDATDPTTANREANPSRVMRVDRLLRLRISRGPRCVRIARRSGRVRVAGQVGGDRQLSRG
jgi:hypothetical protein